MIKLTTDEVREFLRPLEGKEISLADLRRELQILPGTDAFDDVRTIMFRLVQQGIVKASGKRNGVWKVIKKVNPVPVFSVHRERKPPVPLMFPKDRNTEMELEFAEHIVIREGDCILIAGQSNFGKTTLAMNFLGENIDKLPVLLGNEFTKDDDPTPRFLNRLDAMDWVEWVNGDGQDKFTLLPVYDDFAENIVKGRINIIDWINLPGEYYLISPIMEAIKHAIGNGIAILVIQKNPGLDYGRGGAPTKDFADLEILIDKHSNTESRITIGKVKESTGAISGRSWAFGIFKGVKLTNVREVKKCWKCYGKGYTKSGDCADCRGRGWIDV
jgi:energy-coupling factor transporter ATP-binding protein EcfA2